MKKQILIGLLGLAVVAPALAVSVCAKNELVTVVLDPSIGGNSYTYSNTTGSWQTVFSYGTVTGISACLTTGGSYGVANQNIDAVGGETLGGNCWCKMTHPMASAWVFSNSRSFCASDCADVCGYRVQLYAAFRSGLFGSVAP